MTLADPATTVAAILERRIEECGRQRRRLDLTASERRSWANLRNALRARLWQIENPEAHAEHQRAYRARQRGMVEERVDRRRREHRGDRQAMQRKRLLARGLCPTCETSLLRKRCMQCGRVWEEKA